MTTSPLTYKMLERMPRLSVPRIRKLSDMGNVLNLREVGYIYDFDHSKLQVKTLTLGYMKTKDGRTYKVDPKVTPTIFEWINIARALADPGKVEFGRLPNGNDYAEFILSNGERV